MSGLEQGMVTTSNELSLSAEQMDHLQNVGYGQKEIETFAASAQNENDVAFLSSLANGDYENAFKVNPGALSDVCKLQLSNYNATLATRADASVYAAETGEQINALYARKSYAYTPEAYATDGPVNTYEDYIPEIKAGLEQQNGYYNQYMQYMCSNNVPVSEEYITYGEDLNSSIALWDSFEKLYGRGNEEFKEFEQMYGKLIADKAANMQVNDIVKDDNGQYGYRVDLVNPSDGERIENGYSINVEIDRKIGSDVLNGLIVEDNSRLRSEMADLKQGAVVDTAISLYDSMVPFPVKDGYELFVSLDEGLNGSQLLCGEKITEGTLEFLAEDDMVMAGAKQMKTGSTVLGFIGEVADGMASYSEKKQELEAEIIANNQKLSISQSGQSTRMNLMVSENGGPMLLNNTTPLGVNNVLPEVQYNMARWQSQGIEAYLGDLGIEDTEKAKTELLSALDVDMIALGLDGDDLGEKGEKITTVKSAIDIMVNGGDFSTIRPDVFAEVQSYINEKLETKATEGGMENGLHSWILKKNGIQSTAPAKDVLSISNEKISIEDVLAEDKLNLAEPRFLLFTGIDGKLQMEDMKTAESMGVISEKLNLNGMNLEPKTEKISIVVEEMVR